VEDSLEFTEELDEDEERANDELEIMKPDFEAIADEEDWEKWVATRFWGSFKEHMRRKWIWTRNFGSYGIVWRKRVETVFRRSYRERRCVLEEDGKGKVVHTMLKNYLIGFITIWVIMKCVFFNSSRLLIN